MDIVNNPTTMPPPIQPVQPPVPITPQAENPQNKPNIFSKKITRKTIITIGGFIVIIAMIIGGMYFFGKYQRIQKVQEINHAITNAQTYYQKGDYKNAENQILGEVAKNPNDASLLANIIYLYAAEGNQSGTETKTYRKAYPYIVKALKLYPHDASILMSVGYATETIRNYEKASQYYALSLKQDSKRAETWFHMGHVQEFLNNQTEAYKDYDKAYALDSQNPLILIAQGRKNASQAKLEEAYSFFYKAATTKKSTPSLTAEAYTDAAIIKRSQLVNIQDALSLAKSATIADPTFSAGFPLAE